MAAMSALPLFADDNTSNPAYDKAIAELETWLTADLDFRDVSRGKPTPHSIPDEKKREVGMTRDTWKLDVVSDPEFPSRVRKPMSKENDNAFDFAALMELARTKAVKFPKVMTCLNIGCPLGTGIWEGVPLRDLLWLAQPTDNVRRVRYYGYHNNDEKQIFRSSMPISRILEDPFDLPPVILCYKLNGNWLTPERGGPVRMVVPEAYGFKSIKWLSHILLSNIAGAKDTYSEKNNDVDSPLKTFCATFSAPKKVKANEPIPITGWAQVGISGLSKVQVWIENENAKIEGLDKYYTQAPWQDATILGPPTTWGGGLKENKIPADTLGFENGTNQPTRWPLPLTKVHWATLHAGLPQGDYVLRCRTVDAKGAAQPMPRPFRKLGYTAIEQVGITVE